MIFHRRTPLYVPELDVMQDRLTVSGQVNFSSHLYAGGDTAMIVVVFRPHTMSLFLNVPSSLFYNREVSGYSLEDKSLNALAARMSGCGDNAVCIRHMEDWLLSRLAGASAETVYGIKRMDAVIRQIGITLQVPVTALSSIACLGKKQFERSFNALAGINPKEYARIVRFRKALARLQRQSGETVSYAQIAYASGYADQSHLIREFRRFCGHTPAALLKVPGLCSGRLAGVG